MTTDMAPHRRLREAAEWLVRLSLGRASESELRAWIEWSAADEANLCALEDLERLWRELGNSPPSADLLSALLAREASQPESVGPLSHHTGPEPYRRHSWTWRALSLWTLVGASIAVVIVALLFHGVSGNGASRSVSLASGLGQRRVFLLGDGSKVELGGSSLVNVRFTRRQRLLTLLSGEAYFQETHSAHRPFIVAAGQLRVTAKGTAFDVALAGDAVSVGVVEGVVDVSIGAGASSAPPSSRGSAGVIEIEAGRELRVSGDGAAQQRVIDPQTTIAWRRGELESPDAPLREFIQTINRYAREPIVIADPSVGALRYSGAAFTDSIDAWVDSLPKVFPIVVDRSSQPGIIILRPR